MYPHALGGRKESGSREINFFLNGQLKHIFCLQLEEAVVP